MEFYWNSSGIKGTFFHWKRVIPLEFPLDSGGNSTGSVEIPLDSVEIPLNSSGIPLDSSRIPLDLVEIPLNKEFFKYGIYLQIWNLRISKT